MIYVQVNGGHFNMNVVEDQEKTIREILFGSQAGGDVHKRLCAELRIGQFCPAAHVIPYALMRTQLEFTAEGRQLIASFGGDFVCYRCSFGVNGHKGTVECPQCKATKIPNFKPIMTSTTIKAGPGQPAGINAYYTAKWGTA